MTDTTEIVPATTPAGPPVAAVDDAVATEVAAGEVAAGEVAGDAADEWAVDPVWAATGSIPVQNSPTTSQLPVTQPIERTAGGIWGLPVAAETVSSVPLEPAPATGSIPVTNSITITDTTPHTTAEMPVVPVQPDFQPRFRFVPITLISIVAGLITLASVFVNVLSITSDVRLAPGANAPVEFRTGEWLVDDLASNFSIAGLVAALTMIVGGIAAGFGWRWGAGFAGGGGLAFAGVAALAVGLAQIPIDAAHQFALIPPEQAFTLTITRDLGYWLLVAAGAIGVILFFASLNETIGDRRRGLNPWFAALGALATVVLAAGPLLPENLARLDDNWYVSAAPGSAPALLLIARLSQLALLLVTGVVGFLLVRRYGLGLAIGGALPIVWLAISTQFEIGERPVGPAYQNPGAADMHVHGVTIIGVSAIIAVAILAVIAAYDQGIRERP